MPINKAFFDNVRAVRTFAPNKTVQLFRNLTQQQVDAMNAVVAVFDAFTGAPRCIDDLAYILATCYAECGPSLNLAIEEIGRGAGKPYGIVTGPYNKKYYGRGPPQVTWLKNYNVGKLRTGIDFVQFPELMCDPAKGIVYMIDAMYAGLFTTKSLRTYITPGKVTTFAAFGECRRIINGTDRKDEIAYVAMAFVLALQSGYETPTIPSIGTIQSPPRQGLLAHLLSVFGRK